MVPPKNGFLSLRLPIFGASYHQCFYTFGMAPWLWLWLWLWLWWESKSWSVGQGFISGLGRLSAPPVWFTFHTRPFVDKPACQDTFQLWLHESEVFHTICGITHGVRPGTPPRNWPLTNGQPHENCDRGGDRKTCIRHWFLDLGVQVSICRL